MAEHPITAPVKQNPEGLALTLMAVGSSAVRRRAARFGHRVEKAGTLPARGHRMLICWSDRFRQMVTGRILGHRIRYAEGHTISQKVKTMQLDEVVGRLHQTMNDFAKG